MNVVALRQSQERFVTADQLARTMGVSKRTVMRWAAEGMPSETWGLRARRFLPSECVEWARGRKGAA